MIVFIYDAYENIHVRHSCSISRAGDGSICLILAINKLIRYSCSLFLSVNDPYIVHFIYLFPCKFISMGYILIQ